jgi:hypothetical protein
VDGIEVAQDRAKMYVWYAEDLEISGSIKVGSFLRT